MLLRRATYLSSLRVQVKAEFTARAAQPVKAEVEGITQSAINQKGMGKDDVHDLEEGQPIQNTAAL